MKIIEIFYLKYVFKNWRQLLLITIRNMFVIEFIAELFISPVSIIVLFIYTFTVEFII